MNKKKKFLLIFLIILVIGLGAISYCLLWGGDFLVFKVNSPVIVVDKIRSVEKLGGTVELTEADFNALLELTMKNRTFSGDLIVKGIYSQIIEGKLKIYVPVSYRGLNLLILATGDIGFNEDKVIFQPNTIKVGKLQLPIEFVTEKLHSYSIAGGTVQENGSVEMPKQLIPFNYKSIMISGNKLLLAFDKPQQQNAEPKPSAEPKPIVAQTAPSPTSGVSNSKAELLKKAKSQLSGVYSYVKTAAEKAVIGQIQAVVAKMVDNPDYPYSAESESVKAQYNRLSTEEKSDIKDAILENMDTDTLREIKRTFGL